MTYIPHIHSRDWHHLSLLIGAALFPVLIAFLLTGFVPVSPPLPFAGEMTPLEPIGAVPARQLESLFAEAGYLWPPQETVPAVAVSRLPHDIGSLDIPRKKALFFRALLPLVMAENERLHAERRWLEGVMRSGDIDNEAQRARLRLLLGEYGLDNEAAIDAALLERLHQRIDVIPPGLVLAQAANESGWGTSRFSREVNNLFGEWTYRAEHGVVPLRRRDDANHYVRRFDNLRQSVRSYLGNLNSSRAYRGLRQLRASLRRQGREPDAWTLAGGLVRYSARGEEYVAEVRAMILSNGLNDLGPLRLARSATAG